MKKRGNHLNKKGIYFSIDAILALGIIFFVVLLAFPFVEQRRVQSTAHVDMLNVLEALKMSEIEDTGDPNWMSAWLTDPELTILEQIAKHHALGNTMELQGLTNYALTDLDTRENIGLWFTDDKPIWVNITSCPWDVNNVENVDVSNRFVSGVIGEDGNLTGFSARATLDEIFSTKYFYFGGYVGDGSNISINMSYVGQLISLNIELVIIGDGPVDFDVYVDEKYVDTFVGSLDEFTPVKYFINAPVLPGDIIMANPLNYSIVELVGENLHVAGGFLKITYKSAESFEPIVTYKFPGILPLINLYDGFYVPGEITEIRGTLHINSPNVTTFLTIGDETVFRGTTDDEEYIDIDTDDLDEDDLSKKTIPLRLGLENVSFVVNGSNVDVFSVTDISGSMGGSKLIEAKAANKILIDIVLNNPGNRVGLVGYNASVPDADFHELSDDNVSLNAVVDFWSAAGGTCICCGILEASDSMVKDSSPDKFKSMIVMSDGEANVKCSPELTGTSDLDGDGTADTARDHAINASCMAFDNDNITVHAIGFGTGVDETTLQAIKDCGNGTYEFADLGDLEEIYEDLIEDILEAAFEEQTLIVPGDLFTQVFADSYIDFTYEPQPFPLGLVITSEKAFKNKTSGEYKIPVNAKIVETRVSSYSGPRWTDTLDINGNRVYSLPDYESDYIELGDPYSLNIPNSMVLGGDVLNNVTLTTASVPNEGLPGSASNKIIYTIAKDFTTFTGIKTLAEGCFWNIAFENEENITRLSIPSQYEADGGTDQCYYSPANYFADGVPADGPFIANENDVLQVAVFDLLRELDINENDLVEVPFPEDGIRIGTTGIMGIPFTFEAHVQSRIWSC